MKQITLLSLLYFFDAVAFASSDSLNIRNASDLEKMWSDQEVYSILTNPEKAENLDGVYYQYSSKKCFKVDHDFNSDQPIRSKSVPCTDKIKKSALDSYTKISDFEEFKKSFIECLEKKDIKCLRSFTSYTITIDFGVVPQMDRRDLLYKDWEKKDYDKMLSLINKGVELKRSFGFFPSGDKSKNKTNTWGTFHKKNNFWLLVHYVDLLKKSKYQKDITMILPVDSKIY